VAKAAVLPEGIDSTGNGEMSSDHWKLTKLWMRDNDVKFDAYFGNVEKSSMHSGVLPLVVIEIMIKDLGSNMMMEPCT